MVPKKLNDSFDVFESVYRVPIGKLRLWSGNPRKHQEKDLDNLVKSIGHFGWVNPIVADPVTYRVICGHGRIAAAKEIGETEVPVIFREWDEADQTGYTIQDNRSSELSQWDSTKLRDLLVECEAGDYALKWTGFSSDELNRMVAEAEVDSDFIETRLQGTGGGKEQPEEANEQFQVLITCKDELEQVALLNRLEGEGYECQAVS